MRVELLLTVVAAAFGLPAASRGQIEKHDAPLLIPWICPDPLLFAYIQTAIMNYQTVDDISNYIDQVVQGYKNAMWLVNAVNYSRTTATTNPDPNASSSNLCFLQAPNENIIVFVVAISPT